MGDDITMEIMRNHYKSKKAFGSQIYHEIMKRYRHYMCVGGMPQAVEAYIKNKDFSEADSVKQSIISLYCTDMEYQQEENSDHVVNFFERIPSELSKHDKRYVLSHIDSNARIRDYGGAIKWLDDAKIINLAQKVSKLTVAFNLTADDRSFKCYLLDTGLLVTLTYRDKDYLENELYRNILADKLHVNEGMFIENLVAQALVANGHRCYFYRKEDVDEKKTYEVDFVIRDVNKLKLVEVKSSGSKYIKSLKKAEEIYGKSIEEMVVLHHGDIKKGKIEIGDKDIIYLPYFMACLL